MLHRAILGSLERFVGVLLEHYAGVLPLWLAPVQASVLTITSRQDDYARRVVSRLEAEGFRVVHDLRNEKIGLKIRERTLERIPYLFVVGGQEESSGSVSVRTHDGRNLGVMTLDNVIDVMKREARPRSPNDGAEGGRAHRL
jgi:threonyl-tRNA synthetase